MYTYFIHYTFDTFWWKGDGNGITTRNKTISTCADIRAIESEIAEHGKFKTVIITNFILLNKVED